MRFHLVSLPHTNTTDDFSACAFTEKVRKFAIMMMSLDHEVYLYAGEQNTAPCTAHVPCIDEPGRVAACDDRHYTQASFNFTSEPWVTFNSNAIREIGRRIQPKDFICVIGGRANQVIAEAFPANMTVEFGIGYGGTFSKYRVWESYAWMHTCYGAARPYDPNGVDGIWFDAVIPGYFEVEKFSFSAKKDDYFFYIGRLTDRKGWRIAEDVCQNIGAKLYVAGAGDMPVYGEYVGTVGPERRDELMKRARAVFVPTVYIEPFGNVAVEAMACGTPVICTDWGAMTETVIHGVTGYRCRTLQEFVDATLLVQTLDPHIIRKHAIDNYSLPVIAQKYDRHFRRLLQLWGDGWYELERTAA